MSVITERSSETRWFRLSGSTVFVLVALLAWLFTAAQGRFFPKFVDVPVRAGTLIVYLIWPAASVVGAVWAAINLARTRRAQFAVELFMAILSLLLVYYTVIQAPVGD